MRWFQALLPREDRFFDYFVQHAQTLLKGAEALRELLMGGDGVPAACAAIMRQEEAADEITRTVMLAVRRTFITPFDRSDIRDLTTALDDAIDQMQKTAKSITLFGVREFPSEMRELGDLAIQAAYLTVEATELLRDLGGNATRLNGIVEAVTRIENRSDEVYDAGMQALFRKSQDRPMDFIVGADIYDHLEKVIDRFEDVANGISGILLEHLWRTVALLPDSMTLVLLVAVALAFDFLNGLHDAANSIATIVSTRVLKPRYAVLWAAAFNFIAFLFFGLHVAKTVGAGIISVDIVTDRVIFGALMGAIVWNVVTWLAGIPSSSSHALVGGLVGAGVTKAGLKAIVWDGVIKTVSGIVISPAMGFMLALLLVLIVSWIFVRSRPAAVDRLFRSLQFVSASLYSLGHGGNDAQKTMGVIAVLLFAHSGGHGAFNVPLWVVLSCQTAMALGTLMGGWRIVHTMGSKITRLTPMQGFCAETGGAITLFMATYMGIPVSTTHTITGAIVGVGAARRTSAVRWGVARRIVVAWVVTMPAAALIGAAAYALAGGFLK